MNIGPNRALQANVLTLNRGFLAIHVVPLKRALCMLFKGMAEVVNVEDGMYMSYDFDSWLEMSDLKVELEDVGEHDEWLLAVNFSLQVPRVIRLLKYDRVPRYQVKFNRRNVFLRDEYSCQYCGKSYNSGSLSLDHVLPRSQGGGTSWDNIVTACLKCNERKGGRTPKQARMPLKIPPKKPKNNPLLTHQVQAKRYECWKSFLH
jgi:5-methylcytosine-specific restriction endonuclease McrA